MICKMRNLLLVKFIWNQMMEWLYFKKIASSRMFDFRTQDKVLMVKLQSAGSILQIL